MGDPSLDSFCDKELRKANNGSGYGHDQPWGHQTCWAMPHAFGMGRRVPAFLAQRICARRNRPSITLTF